ncbi:PREDICTED: uncharacterized protein LOC104807923 [Tarenaya hassleriana]|uniref:uncharacterized protein LOC104807923 n=1 Tax=Tarenaya hassleriana TaxID=28532 RepID=UPI00053C8F19|nr:PREDICTED: uncharacterized protein LOC104807923 [Tarenaya hassleriana]
MAICRVKPTRCGFIPGCFRALSHARFPSLRVPLTLMGKMVKSHFHIYTRVCIYMLLCEIILFVLPPNALTKRKGDMRRSASSSRVSDQFPANNPAPSPSPSPSPSPLRSLSQSSVTAEERQQLLPRYDPNSHPGKREKSRLRSSENVIHIIPLVLVLCAVILWLFSHPVTILKQ